MASLRRPKAAWLQQQVGGRRQLSPSLYILVLAAAAASTATTVVAAAVSGGVNSTSGGCLHPAVPGGATYVNVSGGLGQDTWKIKYDCDIGYELFGDAERECRDGKWPKDRLPMCAVNVARYKPATASSVQGGGEPGRAVDGAVSTVHEGRRCTETQSEQSPWWAVDLLSVQAVKYVRITTRCCDDLPVKNLEIRVGNSTTYKDNPMCNWIPGSLPQGESKTVECVTEDASGRYVSLSMTGATGALSLCEVEIFTPLGLATAGCAPSVSEDTVVFNNSCYWFVKKGGGDQDNLGYEAATKACASVGYRLAYGVGEPTAKFLRHRLEAEGRAGGGTLVWIGAERNGGGDTWQWSSGTAVEQEIVWGAGQPNNYANEQNCAVLDSDLEWKWNDISCKVDAKTICRGEAERCPAPSVGEGTWVTAAAESRRLGGTIRHHCPIGNKPIGNQNQTCEAGGAWSGGGPISCQFVDCGDVPGLLNGAVHVLDGRTTYGARIKYQCNTDYSLVEGSEERTCAEGGWTGAAARCEFTRCPDPEPVANAAELKQIPGPAGDNRLGAKLIYTCSLGHVARGSLSRECQLGGAWSGAPPTCEFVDCGQPPELLNGSAELLSGRTTYAAEARYTCAEDYNISGDQIRRCEANGKWSKATVECRIIKCPTPRAPTGGRVSGYNYEVHRKVEYSCMDGHKLEGDPVLQCDRSGQWNGPSPKCRYVDCGRIPELDGVRVVYVNKTTHLDSHVRFVCDKTFNLIGPEVKLCTETERWLDSQGRDERVACEEVRCPMPPRPNNTVVSISSTERLHGTSVIRSKLDAMANTYKVGSQLKYRCERGYLLDNTAAIAAAVAVSDRVASRRCTADGTWTGETPNCTYVDCGLPEGLDNGDYALQNNGTTYYGSVVFYSCSLGWRLDGFEKRTCQAAGRWEPEAPRCLETLCPQLQSADPHMQVNVTTLRIGGTATFACEHGYRLVGDPDLECLSSGSWSGWPPACLEIDCGPPYAAEHAKVFLVNEGSTKYGASVEYTCEPGYTRDGPFKRTCEINGYWSGQDPVCYIPKAKAPAMATSSQPAISSGGDSENLLRIGGGSDEDADTTSSSSVGVWIGVALGLIVVIGLMIVGIYFYKKQQMLHRKPPITTAAALRVDNNNSGGFGGFVGGLMPSFVANGSRGGNGHHHHSGGSQIGVRPPPPIQMYSIDDSTDNHLNDHRGPIYDTINDGEDSGHSSYSRSNGSASSDHHVPNGGVVGGVYPRSTFGPPGGGGPNHNAGFVAGDYDIPEGEDPYHQRQPPQAKRSSSGGVAVGTVTINGIAV